MILRLGSANMVMLAAHIATIGILGIIAPPKEFGLFLLALSISLPFSSFAGLRLESALPSLNSGRELKTVLALATLSVGFVCLLQLGTVLWLGQLQMFEVQTLDALSIAALTALTFTQALIQIGRLWAIRHQQIDAIARATKVRAAATLVLRGSVVVALLIGVAGFLGSIGTALILCELAIAILMASQLFPAQEAKTALGKLRKRVTQVTLRKNWKFPVLETPSSIIDNLAANAPLLLVTQFFGLTATASFGLAFRGLAVPIAQLSKTLTEVMQTRYSELQRSGEWRGFANLFFRSSAIAIGLALAGTAATILVSYGLIQTLEDAYLREVLWIIILISPWIASSAVVNINSRILLMLKRQELKLVYDGLQIVFIVLLWILQRTYSPDLFEFVWWISCTQVAAYGVYWMLIWVAIKAESKRAALV